MAYETDGIYETEMDEYESGDYEYGDGEHEYEAESEEEAESPFDEASEMDLAAELLDVNSEGEMDYFLKDLLQRATQTIGGAVRSPAGQQLVGLLKGAAKKALPGIGAAIGGRFGGASGARIGGQLAQQAGQIFGLELEGMSPEDQEFEVARRFVRCAGAAAGNLAHWPHWPARKALRVAAQRFAPGLFHEQEFSQPQSSSSYGYRRPYGYGSRHGYPASRSHCPYCARSSGRWVKMRGRIVLM
jgi:hypothetical protein